MEPDDQIAVFEQSDESPTPETSTIVGMVENKYTEYKAARQDQDDRHLLMFKNWRGVYDEDTAFTSTEKSKIFIKVTKTKVVAAYGIIHEILFPDSATKFPVELLVDNESEIKADAVHFDPKAPKDQPEKTIPDYGYPGDGKDLEPGETTNSLMTRMGTSLSKLLAPVKDSLKEGEGKTPTAVTYHPAAEAAKKLNEKVQDQLAEGKAHNALKKTLFETVLFGTGCMRGPFAVNKEYPKWDEDGKYAPITRIIPTWEHISIWNIYPDPDSRGTDDLDSLVIRHRMTREKLLDLKRREHFDSDKIDDAVAAGSNYIPEQWEDDLDDDESGGFSPNRWELLEYWGSMDTAMAEDCGLDIPDEYEDLPTVKINAWVCNGILLKAILNPFEPAKIPYHFIQYESNPYSFWGIGIAENMSDTQLLMNGFMRLAVDNAVLSGNVMLDIDMSLLEDGQEMEISPGKIFRREGGQTGTAINDIKIENVSNQNLQLFDKARQLADESTGLPSFAHGQTGVSGVGRTAAGISMLMGAASTSSKTVIKNVDEFLEGLVKSHYWWLMQFDYDPELHYDITIKAGGTDALLNKEMRAQRLLQFLQIASNPVLAPFVKFPYVLGEIAKSLDLDDERILNDAREAMVQAEVMRMTGSGGQGAPGQGQGAPGMSPNDPTGGGGGMMGVGQPALPGQQGFAGQPQGGGMPPPGQGGAPQPSQGGMMPNG